MLNIWPRGRLLTKQSCIEIEAIKLLFRNDIKNNGSFRGVPAIWEVFLVTTIIPFYPVWTFIINQNIFGALTPSVHTGSSLLLSWETWISNFRHSIFTRVGKWLPYLEREIELLQRDEVAKLTENTAIQMGHVLLITQKEPFSIFSTLSAVLFRQQLQLLSPPLPESGEKTWIIWFQGMSALIPVRIHQLHSHTS